MSSSGLLTAESSASIYLYSSAGSYLDSLYGEDSVRLTSGTYYIDLTGSSYTFKLTLESAKESFKETSGGSNNSTAKASKVSLGNQYRGQIAVNDTVDYYRFTLPAAGRLSLSAVSYFGAQFTWYDANGTEMWRHVLSPGSSSTRESASWTCDLGRGTYYLKVDGYREYSDRTGVFTFKATLKDAKESFAESQGGSNNFFGSASSIKLNKTYVSQLALNDSKDIFKFTAKESGVVRVKASSSLSKTDYSLLDAHGDKLASSSGARNETTGKQGFTWTRTCGKGTRYLVIERSGSGEDTTGPVSFSVSELKDISQAKIGAIASQAYTGSAIKPSLTVKRGGKTLRSGIDYTASFSNNVNAGTATVEVKGKGDWTGKKTATFKIERAAIARAGMDAIESHTYTGSEIRPEVALWFGGKTLVEGTDYTVGYADNRNAGTATVTIAGAGNFQGKRTATFKIAQASLGDAWVEWVSGDDYYSSGYYYGDPSYTYTGSAIEPAFMLKLDYRTLIRGTDYTVRYSSNTDVGTAQVEIAGTGNYTGSLTETFAIEPASIYDAQIGDIALQTYTGRPIEPSFTLTVDGRTLRRDVDYVVAYTDNTNAGEARIWIEGTGNYDGSLSEEFTIAPANIAPALVGRIKSHTYTGSEIEPVPAVVLGGKSLRLGSDFLVGYSDNVDAGTARATITGTGNYQGTKAVTFKIKKAKQKIKVKRYGISVNSLYTIDYWEKVKIDPGELFEVSGAYGKLKFKKVKASALGKKFKVKKGGAVVVKAGTPDGTYKLKIKVKAKGDKNHKKAKKAFWVKVKVKYW